MRAKPGFYAIIDPDACLGRDPLVIAEAVLTGGCSLLQLRTKRQVDRERIALGTEIARRCRHAGVPVVVNDRVDLALLCGADAVHLGQDDLPIAAAHEAAAGRLSLGISTHTLDQLELAMAGGASYLGFGPVFATATKANPDPVVGLAGLKVACSRSDRPVVAIGGITAAQAPMARQAGATWVAAIAAVCGAPDPAAAARALHQSAGGDSP